MTAFTDLTSPQVAELLTGDGVVRKALADVIAERVLDETVGFGDRRQVGLGDDLEVSGTEAFHRDGIGAVGELHDEGDLGWHVAQLSERSRSLSGAPTVVLANSPNA